MRDRLMARYSRLPPYTTMYRLEGNPVECDCWAARLAAARTSLQFTGSRCGLGLGLTCRVPGGFGMSEYRCPAGCNCRYSGAGLLTVDCNGRGLSGPPLLPSLRNTDRLALLLAGNRIAVLPATIANHSQLARLDLARNSLVFLPALPTLLKRNVSLSLAGNPLSCSCNSSALHRLAAEQDSGLLADWQQLSLACPAGPLLLHSVERRQFCPDAAAAALMDELTASSTFIISLIAVVLLLYLGRRRYLPGPATPSRSYDVFISYR